MKINFISTNIAFFLILILLNYINTVNSFKIDKIKQDLNNKKEEESYNLNENNELILDLDTNKEVNYLEALLDKDFHIRIKNNLTTGYTWQISTDVSSLAKQGFFIKEGNVYGTYKEDSINNSNKLPKVGDEGYLNYDFLSIKEGTFQVDFINKRPWEENGERKVSAVISVKSLIIKEIK